MCVLTALGVGICFIYLATADTKEFVLPTERV
jgi:hypothetical protein